MATFNFNCGFYLLLDDGTRIRFQKGAQDVPDDLADHPYLAANGERVEEAIVEPAPEPIPDPEPAPEPPAAEPDPDATGPDDDVSEHDALVAQAEALGINVDGRWGVARLKAEIAKVAG
ncbi:hypothetical protein V5F49_20500 [Xanthobacter sp. V3C-3]|uniref:hypothetical protein n=1 Tax=Xanthobacter lutulentifluminis TaxID=3119935 RepID=UPI003729766A